MFERKPTAGSGAPTPEAATAEAAGAAREPWGRGPRTEPDAFSVGAQSAPPDIHEEVGARRSVLLRSGEHPPASCDGRVAYYRRQPPGRGEPNRRHAPASVPAVPAVWTTSEFEVVARENRAMLFRRAMALTRDRYDAEDLVQETLARAWERRNTFRHAQGAPCPSSASAWLTAILRNKFNNAYHHRKRRASLLRTLPFTDLDGTPIVGSTVTPEAALMRAADGAALAAALTRVPDLYREALAFAADGLPYAQIAAELGVPVGTVRSRIFRGRRCLQRALPELAGSQIRT